MLAGTATGLVHVGLRVHSFIASLAAGGVVGGLTPDFFSFIGYNMDPDLLERTLAEDLAQAVADQHADLALLSPA